MSESYKPLQQMNAAEILKQTISLYRQNLPKFLEVVLPGIPVVIFCILIFSTNISSALDNIPNILSMPTSKISEMPTETVYKKLAPIMMLISLIMYFYSATVTAAGIIVISELFLGREIKVVDAYKKIRHRIFPLLGAIILTFVIIYLATAAGMLLCVIPGIFAWIYLSVWFSFITPVVMLEGEGGMGAIKCSRTLIKEDSRKSLIVIGSVMGAILVAWIFLLVGNVIATQFNIIILSPIGNLISISALILLEPIKFTAITLLYYDLRVRREGYDLKVLSEELSAEI